MARGDDTMKKSRTMKFCTMSLVMISILSVFIPNYEVHAQRMTKKAVTIRAGQKKKIKIGQKNVKKIRVKSSKKSVAIVKSAGKKRLG